MRMRYQVLQAFSITLHKFRDVGTSPWAVQYYLCLPENPTVAHVLQVYVWDVVLCEMSSIHFATVHTCRLALSPFTSPLFKNVVYPSIVDFQHCVNFFCTGKRLLYTGTHSFSYSFPYGLSQDSEYDFLRYTVGRCCLSTLYITVSSANPKLPIHPSPAIPFPWQPQAVHCACLFLFRKVPLCHNLDSTYKWSSYLSFSDLTSLGVIISRSIYGAVNGIISFILCWIVFHCVCVCVCVCSHLLYLFTCQWTFRLLPCLDYSKWCCYEHWDACIFWN